MLDLILSHTSREDLVGAIHDYLNVVKEDCQSGKVPIEQYIIRKGLTKDPKEYSDKKNQPHVQVALRMISKNKSVKALDTVPYLICSDGTENPATQRAYHPDEFRKQEELKIDIEYYLKSQVHPVVSRLCDPIQGTDRGQIADCLGLDSSAYDSFVGEMDEGRSDFGFTMFTQQSDDEKYSNAEDFRVQCQKCGETTKFDPVLRNMGKVKDGSKEPQPSLCCGKCGTQYPVHYLQNQLTLTMRSYINRYYLGELRVDDPSYRGPFRETRQVSVNGNYCIDPQCNGVMHPVYSDKQLYVQTMYLQHLFDVDHHDRKWARDEATKGAVDRYISMTDRADYKQLHDHMTTWLQKNARREVKLGNLFSSLGIYALEGTK